MMFLGQNISFQRMISIHFYQLRLRRKVWLDLRGRAFIFEGITLDIKRKTITETTLTVTYSKLNADTLLNLMEEQNGSD